MAEFKKLPFGKVLKDVTRNYSKIPKSEYLDEGLYPIIDQGKDFICGYTNDPESVTEKDKPIIIFGDHTRVFKFIDFPIAIGADGVKVLEVDSSLADEEFVYEYLCTINLHNAGYSRHFKYLKEVKIPVPDSIDVQKRIAAVLQKTDLLISKRKESIELANEFLKHTFLTMFGDPILNEKKWKTEVFDKVTNKVTDGEHQNPKLTNSGFNLIMAKDVLSNTIDFSQNKFVSELDFKKFTKKCKPERGDILLVSRGATIGRCVEVKTDKPFCLMGSVILIKPSKKAIIGVFINQLFKNEKFLKKLTKTSGYSAQQAIYLKNLKQVKIIVPPIEHQKSFEKIALQVDIIKSNFSESLNELIELYSSLSKKAFNGDLTIIEKIYLEGSIKVQPKISATVEIIEHKPLIKTITKPVKKKEEVTASITHIPFLKTEEDLISHISRNCSGSYFTFEEIKQAIKGLDWKYDFEELKNLVFSLVRKKQLKQVFADASYKSGFGKSDADFKEITDLSEQIYFKRML
jgi:type I restriction enzyme S subunit